MEVCEEKNIFPQKTDLNKYSYCFTPKHHGAGLKTGPKAPAQWLPDLPRQDEFEVFNMADVNEIRDEIGNLYGLRIQRTGQGREILALGTWHQMIARFWKEEPPNPWHGHPLWMVGDNGPEHLKKQPFCPPRSVFARMIQAKIVTKVEAERLKLGKHIKKLKGV